MLGSEYSVIELNRKIRSRIEECTEIANKHFNTNFIVCSFSFSPRLKKTAGMCYDNHAIVFSSSIIRLNDLDAFCYEVVSHEVAHSIALQKYGTFAHDRYFYYVLNKVFNVNTGRCHSLKTKEKIDYVIYKCACRDEIRVDLNKHEAIKELNITFKCSICKTSIQQVK